MNPIFAIVMTMATGIAAPTPETGRALNELGLAVMSRGDFSGAEALFRQSIAIWKSLGARFEPHLATADVNLGDAMCGQGRWGDAVPLLQQSLQLNRHSLGNTNERTLVSINRLANVYLVIGKIDLVEPLYREALSIERAQASQDLQLVRTLEGLASMHLRERQLDQALPEAEEALEVSRRLLGEGSPETALAYGEVGQIHRTAGRIARALPLLRKGREILERTMGENDPRVASMLSQEGLALMYDGKLALAEQDLVRAVDMLSNRPGLSVELAIAEHNLGMLRIRQKKYSDADTVLSRALALEEKFSAPGASETLVTRKMLMQVRERGQN